MNFGFPVTHSSEGAPPKGKKRSTKRVSNLGHLTQYKKYHLIPKKEMLRTYISIFLIVETGGCRESVVNFKLEIQ